MKWWQFDHILKNFKILCMPWFSKEIVLPDKWLHKTGNSYDARCHQIVEGNGWQNWIKHEGAKWKFWNVKGQSRELDESSRPKWKFGNLKGQHEGWKFWNLKDQYENNPKL